MSSGSAAGSQGRDIERRGEILLEAEKLVLADYVWIPQRFLVTQVIVQPYVKGWVANTKNFNLSRWLSIEKPA